MTNPPLDSMEPFAHLLPLRSVIVTLQFTHEVHMGILHHVPLQGWVRNLCGSPANFGQGIIVEPLENQHHHYQPEYFYRFKVTATTLGLPILEHLITQLQRLPESAKHIKKSGLLHQNVTLCAIHDAYNGAPYEAITEHTLFGLPQLAQQIEQVENAHTLSVQFITPAQFKLRKDAKGTQRYCRNKQDMSWALFSQRVSDACITLIQNHTQIRHTRPQWPDAEISQIKAIWLENRYGGNGKTTKFSGGLLTQFTVTLDSPLTRMQWAQLLIGQHLGIGQSRAFGCGIYNVCAHSDNGSLHQLAPPRPSAGHSLLDLSFTEDNLNAALHHNQKKHGIPQPTIDEIREKAGFDLLNIKQGNYTPPPLTPVDIAKPNGEIRKLSVPPLQDRILQRCAAKTLSDIYESHWIKNSYGYRPGRSRLNAKEEINRLVQEGYEWIVEADVKAFFDSVSWEELTKRLELLFPNEPLDAMIMKWITAGKETQEGTVEPRTSGLPQGAPISPLIANLILDDFDADMHELGYQLVRFADDFVLLFKKEEQAHEALEHVHQSLNEHNLYLHPTKTKVVHKSKGFHFLGYLFIDGYAIETSKASEQEKPLELRPNIPDTPPHTLPNNTLGERQHQGTILIICGETTVLNCHQNKLQTTQDETQHTYNWQSLEAIVLLGNHPITTPALVKAMENQVPIYFLSQQGEYQGVATDGLPREGAALWLLQAQRSQNQHFSLQNSKELVQSRMSGIHSVIYRRDKQWHGLIQIDKYKQKAHNAEDIKTLRGYEGQAAKLLWQFLKETLGNEWAFTGRNRRPPKDPVNAMLSLGYTFLHNLCDAAVRVAGLCPTHGVYHQPRGKHSALASDMQEPFRMVVERTVLTLINRRQIKPDDFQITPEFCNMSSEARKTLLTAIMQELTQPRSNHKTRLLDDIFSQPIRLNQSIRQQANFRAWRP